MNEPVILEKDGPIARLVMNRPDRHNALRFDDLDLAVDLLEQAQHDDDVKVIILKGAGRSFCSGHDYDDAVASYKLESTGEGDRPRKPSQRSRLQRDRRLGDGYRAFHFSLKPIIAQVHGVCFGVGLYLVELVDLAICAQDTRFGHVEQRLGLAGNTWHLNTMVLTYGPKRARELMLLGDEFDGDQAVDLGLANRSVPADELEATVESWATRIALHPRDALVTGKAMWQMTMESLGGAEQFSRGYVGHTLGTNLRLEPDEFNFLKELSLIHI